MSAMYYFYRKHFGVFFSVCVFSVYCILWLCPRALWYLRTVQHFFWLLYSYYTQSRDCQVNRIVRYGATIPLLVLKRMSYDKCGITHTPDIVVLAADVQWSQKSQSYFCSLVLNHIVVAYIYAYIFTNSELNYQELRRSLSQNPAHDIWYTVYAEYWWFVGFFLFLSFLS